MQEKMTKHKHHILPRHMGGTDDPTNLVDLTVEEHSLAHKELWEKYGRWQDNVAWKALSGQIDKQEIIALTNAARRGKPSGREGKKHSPESIEKIRLSKMRHTYNQGRKHSEQSRKNMSESHKGLIPYNKGLKYEIVKCPYCSKDGGSNLMKRYHFENCKDKK